MKTDVIHLEKTDDILSVREKITFCVFPRILLVIPENRGLFNDRLSLSLLQRAAVSQGAQLGIVSRSSELQSFADEAGIPVFESEKEALKRPWRRKGKLTIKNTTHRKVPDLQRPLLPETRSLESLPWLRKFAFALGILAVCMPLLFFAPGAVITLDSQQDTQTMELEIKANTSITAVNLAGEIPAYEISEMVIAQGEIPASGKQLLPDQYAEGKVKLTNLTEKEVSVPLNTVVSTLGAPPIRFRLTEAVTVPAGSGIGVEASIEALLAGPDSNVSAGEIRAMEGAAGLQLLVENPSSTSGGSEKESTAPTSNDLNNLHARLSAELQQKALEDLSKKMSDRQVLVTDSLKINRFVKEAQEPELGQPADRLRLELHAEVTAFYVDIDDVEKIAAGVMEAAIPSGFSEVPGSLRITPLSPPVIRGGQIYWEIFMSRSVKTMSAGKPDTTRLIGLTPEEAIIRVQSDLALKKPPQVSLWPSWWPRMPLLPLRIQVRTS